MPVTTSSGKSLMRIDMHEAVKDDKFWEQFDPKKPLPSVIARLGDLEFEVNILDTEEKFDRFCDFLDSTKNLLPAFDTETVGYYGRLAGCSFAFDQRRGWYLPMLHTQGVQLDYYYVLDRIRPYLQDERFWWICWNVVYELVVTGKEMIRMGNYHDGMLLANYIDENIPKALKTRAALELGLQTIHFEEVVKDPSRPDKDHILKVGIYAVQDVILTQLLFHHMKGHNEFKQFKKDYLKVQLPLARVTADMIRRGIMVNPEQVKKVDTAYTIQKEEMEEKIFYEASYNPETGKHEAWYDEDKKEWVGLLRFNLQSSPQKKAVLLDRLKMPVVAWTKGGKKGIKNPAFDSKDALPTYAGMGYKIADYMMKWSKVTKVLQSYTGAILAAMDPEGRIHPHFKMVGTKTGRYSCSDPNFQSMPKKGGVRKSFIAAPGYKLICLDYSQLELRVAAHFSQDENMIRAFKDGIDLHSINAAKIHNFSVETKGKSPVEGLPNELIDPEMFEMHLKAEAAAKKVLEQEKQECEERGERFTKKIETPYADMRALAKIVAFGIQYGMGPREKIGIDKDFINAYLDANPGLRDYIKGSEAFCYKFGFIRTIFGRKRRHEHAQSDNFGLRAGAMRAMFSAHIQGSAGDLVRKAMIDIYDYIQENGIDCHLIAQVHDEILLECREDFVEQMAKAAQEKMENVWPELIVPLQADPGVGDNWEEAKG